MPSIAMRRAGSCAAFLLLQSLLLLPAAAKLREEHLDVAVRLLDATGQWIAQPIKVTVFSDDANPTPAPVVVYHHGRWADARDRASMGRARDLPVARHFVAQGFIVAVPTRVGYGATGGEDVELSGACDDKRYGPGHEAGLAQTLATLEALRARPDVDDTRAVLAGQSYGGAIAIRAAAANPRGVLAAINFSGGGGGNPKTQPQEPCGTDRMAQLFGQYGKTARVPTLWIYTENDQYMGPRYPREWFQAFRDAGGTGEFTMFPSLGEDGHTELLGRFPVVWQPRVRDFLERHGVVREGPMTSNKDAAYTRKLQRVVLVTPAHPGAASAPAAWGALAEQLQRRGVDVFSSRPDPLELRRGKTVRDLASSVRATQILSIENSRAALRAPEAFEASVVDVATGKTVWRAASKMPLRQGDEDEPNEQFSASLLEKLEADGLIRSTSR